MLWIDVIDICFLFVGALFGFLCASILDASRDDQDYPERGEKNERR